ncbi:MAG: undecaprenyl-phosphate glucose phosphotransferase [Phycisphaerae bacterium]|nr:undecaprenyl-phosphate glucose phosphotransferase [Phycisphaerae bacterium]
MLKQQHQLFVALLAAADGVVIALACLVAWLCRMSVAERYLPRSWEDWIKGPLVIFAVPVALTTMWGLGLYRPRRDRSLFMEQGAIFRASLAAVAALVIALWAVEHSVATGKHASGVPVAKAHVWGMVIDGGRLQLALLAFFLPVALGVHRAVFRMLVRAVRRRGRNLRHVAIIGVGRLGQIVERTLSRNSWTGLNVAYFISHHPQTKKRTCLSHPVLGGIDNLEAILDANRVDAVYLAIPNAQAALMPPLLARLDRFAVDVRIIPDVHPRFVPQSMVVNELDGMPILSYRECPSSGLGGFSKRMLDIVGSLAALVIFSPVLLAAMLAVRVSSPGPVIFKQRRVSLGGRVFKIYKLRTMRHVEDELWAQLKDSWTLRDDPRITRVGRFLRRTSLDELPQLINVLKGQMSLVGPRPERPELIERFREDWRGYMIRQHVKAGITGWAQVNGLRGQTSLRKRLQYDLFYIRHWSLGFDLRILWLTLFRGFIHRNAH